MQTINGILRAIKDIQGRIEVENREAGREHGEAEGYRAGGDATHAQAHANIAMEHEQRSLQMQNEVAHLMQLQEALQAQITELDRQKDVALALRDNEIASLDAQIARIRG